MGDVLPFRRPPSDEGEPEVPCPRCGREATVRFYGPCDDCRSALRDAYRAQGRTIDVAEYEPKSSGSENTFSEDLTDLNEIRLAIDGMARDAAAWLDRVGLAAEIRETAQQLAADPSGSHIDRALDRVGTRYMELWRAEAGMKTYGQAVADVIELRAGEGELDNSVVIEEIRRRRKR